MMWKKMKLFEENVDAPQEGAPVAEEETHSVDSPLEEESSEENIWAELLDEERQEPEDVEEEAEAEASTQESVEEPEAEAETEAAPEPVAEEEGQQPEQEEAQEPPKQEPTAEEREALQRQIFDDLQKLYSLEESDAEAVAVEPEKILPKIAAKVHMQVSQQIAQSVVQSIPQMVEQVLQQRETRQSAEEAFFSRWPQLRRHKDQVARFAAVWRQLNPQASVEDAVEGIGKHVMVELGYPIEGGAPAAEPAPANPATPAPPAAVVPPAPTQPKGMFEAFAEEILSDEMNEE